MSKIVLDKDKETLKCITHQDEQAAKKFIILDEDTFVKELDRIIERDFFPDLVTLRKSINNDNIINDDYFTNDLKLAQSKINDPDISIKDYLNKYTSEDNASFHEIIKLAKKRHKNKYPWLYKDEKKIQEEIDFTFKVPSIEDQVKYKKNNNNLITWPYKNKNSIMFNPEGAKYTSKEIYEMNFKNNQKVIYENTRFKEEPFIEEKIIGENKNLINKINHQNFNLVESTPLLEPESLETPLMTWGEIESTPVRLESSDLNKTPSISNVSTHKFKIQNLSSREVIAQKLTDKFSKSYKQNNTPNQFKLKWTPSPLTSSRSISTPRTPRLENMSPAVQRFAANKILNNIQNNKIKKNYHKSISNITIKKT